MNIRTLLERNRSYRRFDASAPLTAGQLKEWIELTRYTASARNMQPLRYTISTEKAVNDAIFPLLAWAGYLKDWAGPAEEERPAAYIVQCKENALADAHVLFDAGAAAQAILLGAVEAGYGGCIIGAVNKPKLRALLQLSEAYEILYVLALGKPAEKVVIEEAETSDIRYWRDENGVHHVPKRKPGDLILTR